MRRRVVAAAALTCGLLSAAPALGATYTVTGLTDVGGGCESVGAGFVCPSVRSALIAARDNLDASDTVQLGAATYVVSQGATLPLSDGVQLVGAGARSTSIDANGSSRVLELPGAATATVAGLTVIDGYALSDNGGNILNQGVLTLRDVRVSGGIADNEGGGIANLGGTLTVERSLIDGNNAVFGGGGIANVGGATPSRLTVRDSTISGGGGNTAGGGILTRGNAGNVTELVHVTFNQNTPDAIDIADAQTVTTYGSLYTINAGDTCGSTRKPTDLGYNVDSGNTCAFTGTGSLPNTNPLGPGSLSNEGGQTDVFTIAAGGPAEDLVASCQSTHDQRNLRRVLAATDRCDAGAYEIQIVADPNPTPTPTPTPTAPPAQTPAPTATATPTATPVFNQTVVAAPVRGTVLVKERGSTRFVALTGADGIPFGSTIDTRRGRVELTSLPSRGGAPQKAQFFDGLFKLVQKGDVTELQLAEALDCRSRRASAAQKKPKTRKLWGDGKGKFRTKGRYAAATIRGTKWLVQDTCTTTLVRVTQGSVLVRDAVKKRNVVLRKNKRYVARSGG